MEEYKKGKVVKGNITGIMDYGIFVSLDNYYSGLIHISEVSNDFVKNIKDYGEIGETIYVKILDVDDSLNHTKLSIKDIDYRMDGKSKKMPIKETGTGFEQLKNNLDKWINDKLEEMN